MRKDEGRGAGQGDVEEGVPAVRPGVPRAGGRRREEEAREAAQEAPAAGHRGRAVRLRRVPARARAHEPQYASFPVDRDAPDR